MPVLAYLRLQMIELKFSLKGRKAYLKSTQYTEELKALLSYSSPGARFSPAYNMRGEDGKRLWDGRTSMFKYGALPVGLLIGAYKELKAGGFKARVVRWKNRPKVELKTGGFWEKSQKYEYQNEACQAILNSFSKGGGTVLSATGTGKTKLSAQVFSHVKGPCLFIVDQINLLYQSQKELQEWLGESVGLVGNGKFEPKRVTVATIQTLHAHQDKKEFLKWYKTVVVIFVDELHKQMAKRNFGVLSLASPEAVIGLTATLQMKKKIVRWKVYAISGPVIFSFDLKKGIDSGVLSRAAVVQVLVQSPDLNYHNYDGKMRELVKKTARYLRKHYEPGPERDYMKNVVCNIQVNNRLLPRLVKEALNQKLAVVVLADRIPHVRLLRQALQKYSPRAVYGKVKQDEREKIIAKFEKAKCNLIVASRVFTKGVNIKRISLIIDTAQKPNRDDAMQKLGRGARLHEEKKGIIYVDISTSPENKKAGDQRKNTFKKAGIPVKVMDWTETDAKEILRTARKLLK